MQLHIKQNWAIPFLSFEVMNAQIREEMREAFERVFASNWYILGKEVANFEAQYAKWNQVKFCVGMANGLEALHLSLRALEIGLRKLIHYAILRHLQEVYRHLGYKMTRSS